MKHTVTCVDFRPLRKNTLVGFARVRIPELRLVIHDIALHEKGETRWASLPAKPQVKDGALVTDDDGKIAYWTVLEFESREARDAFSRAVWAAALERFPNIAEPVA
jgi:hypothetical protein